MPGKVRLARLAGCVASRDAARRDPGTLILNRCAQELHDRARTFEGIASESRAHLYSMCIVVTTAVVQICSEISRHVEPHHLPHPLHIHVPGYTNALFLPFVTSGEAFHHRNSALSIVLVIQKQSL
jgi:hypothetical protein